MIRITQLKLPINHTKEQLEKKIARTLKCQEGSFTYEIIRQSLDARHEDYNFGNQLEHHELQSSGGSVDVKQTTNGDYYYRDSDGVGYTDNGDGTWTDENGNTYTE